MIKKTINDELNINKEKNTKLYIALQQKKKKKK